MQKVGQLKEQYEDELDKQYNDELQVFIYYVLSKENRNIERQT